MGSCAWIFRGFGHYGAPILAAASGQVVLAAWDNYGYGNHVIISHPDGSQTLYAHLSSFAVAKGDRVAAGQRIGFSGTTGNSTGPHLHFELHRNGVVQDPMQYLP